VVLLPGTPSDEAQRVLTRVQRLLSAELFMYEGKQSFVTFSAGVTLYRPSEAIEVALQRADEAFKVYLAAVAGVFVVVGLVLNGMLWLLVVRPITRLAALANQVSLGDMNAPEFAQKGRDEVAELAASFARMRRSMVEALKLLDA